MTIRDADSSRGELLTYMRVKMNDRDLAPPRSRRAKGGKGGSMISSQRDDAWYRGFRYCLRFSSRDHLGQSACAIIATLSIIFFQSVPYQSSTQWLLQSVPDVPSQAALERLYYPRKSRERLHSPQLSPSY